MSADPKTPVSTSQADRPASADELRPSDRNEQEAQDANEALRDAQTGEDESEPIAGLRQSDIRGSSD